LNVINKLAKTDPKAFVAKCEEEYEARIRLAAELIIQTAKKVL